MTTTTVFSSQTLQDTPGTVGLVQQVTIGLAGLLDIDIFGFDVITRDTQRRNGMYLDVVVSYDTSSVADLTSPFVFKAFRGKSAQEVVTALENYKALNPAWWYSSIQVHYSDGINGQSSDPYIGWIVASADPAAGEHWEVGGGGSGGGAYVAILATGIASASVIDQVNVDSGRAVIWEVDVQDNSGNNRTVIVYAQHNGTLVADATTADYTLTGIPSTGTVTAAFTVDLNGAGATQSMRLILTPTAGTWAVTGWRRSIRVATS